MRPSGFRAVTNMRQEAADSADFFPTPPWATRALFVHALAHIGVRTIEVAWEPACGEGHMSGVLEEFAETVIASDLIDYGGGQVADYLFAAPPIEADWIITNPPFNTADAFARKALADAREGVALLVRSNWREGQTRYETLFKRQPPTLIADFVERVPMGKGRWSINLKTATAYSWFVWSKIGGPLSPIGPVSVWIPPCRAALTRHSDFERFRACCDLPKEFQEVA